jgi:molecular chaperone GrpE
MPNEKKEKKPEDLRKKLAECEKLKNEYLASWQRERADFLNYKKGELARVGELVKYADMGIILKILPILDNLELVEKELPDDLKNNENVKGILQIKSQIKDFLKGQGVEEIKSVGNKFDPYLHEIIGGISFSEFLSKNGKEAAPGSIVEEIQKGYIVGGKVLRPAKVKIVK